MTLEEAITIVETKMREGLSLGFIDALLPLVNCAKSVSKRNAVVGRTAKIVRYVFGHGFDIGDVVEVVDYDPDREDGKNYKIQYRNIVFWVDETEFEFID